MPISSVEVSNDGVKVVLAVVILTRLLLKLATVVFGTVDEETAGYVMLLVIYLPLSMHGVGVVVYGSGLLGAIGNGRKSR